MKYTALWRVKWLCAIGTLLMTAMPAHAQSGPAASDSATADTRALILRPLSFFKVQDMDFGDIIPRTTVAGTVRLYPDGSRTATNGIILVNNNHQPARFAGLGTSGRTVLISMNPASTWIYGPGTRMRVRNFEIGSTPTVILGTSPQSFTITSAVGNFNFPLGAILEVGANQAPGDYTGTFVVTLNYQ